MVCDPGRAVPDMDDPALLKAALLDQPLHRRIVGVGIDADIGGKKLAMLGGALEQPVDPPVAGQPMDRDVGLVVQPFALLDVCVGWLRAFFECRTGSGPRSDKSVPIGWDFPTGSCSPARIRIFSESLRDQLLSHFAG